MKPLVTYIDPEKVADEIAQFETVTPTLFREPGFVADYLRLPHVRTASVTIADEKAYIIAFHVTADGGFWVDVAKAVAGNRLDQLFHVINETAKKFECKYIRFTTARHGLIELAQEQGYTPEAILMTKAVL